MTSFVLVKRSLLWTVNTLLLFQVVNKTIGTTFACFAIKIEIVGVVALNAGPVVPVSTVRAFTLLRLRVESLTVRT